MFGASHRRPSATVLLAVHMQLDVFNIVSSPAGVPAHRGLYSCKVVHRECQGSSRSIGLLHVAGGGSLRLLAICAAARPEPARCAACGSTKRYEFSQWVGE